VGLESDKWVSFLWGRLRVFGAGPALRECRNAKSLHNVRYVKVGVRGAKGAQGLRVFPASHVTLWPVLIKPVLSEPPNEAAFCIAERPVCRGRRRKTAAGAGGL
jgi:hypothetical protein